MAWRGDVQARCGLVEPLAAANGSSRSAGNEAQEGQQDDGADRGADDLADDARKKQKAWERRDLVAYPMTW